MNFSLGNRFFKSPTTAAMFLNASFRLFWSFWYSIYWIEYSASPSRPVHSAASGSLAQLAAAAARAISWHFADDNAAARFRPPIRPPLALFGTGLPSVS